MRCQVLRCHYNDDGHCRQPDYAYIDKNGMCEQMDVRSVTITEKYNELKTIADEAYKTFDFNPTQANSDMYGIALNNLRDFCIGFVDQLVTQRPDVTDCIFYEEN